MYIRIILLIYFVLHISNLYFVRLHRVIIETQVFAKYLLYLT